MEAVDPIHYRLAIEPDLKRFDFSATVKITVETGEPITEIVLNAADLAVWRCRAGTEEKLDECIFHVDPKNENLTLTLPRQMTGTIRLEIQYMGAINDRMAGFYRSQYMTGGVTKHIGVTQFQESDARRAFPCFDHPVKKATFDVEMIVGEGLVAISNGPVAETTDLGGGKKRVRFQQTPKMSTYLVFWGVGEFDFIEDSQKTLVRVAAVPGGTAHGRFALEFGRKALEYCQEYYAIPYPLAKLDLIAIPDFAFGAMENWGAITFRENLLLHYPGLTSKAGEERICEVIAHEIVHQWFGNLVSPSDWKYLWLNESFATYFGYGVVHHNHPDWDVWDQFIGSETDRAFERDALRETIPIELSGGGRVAITESTAPIIYDKGGSILRQVEGYIGGDNFKKGLRHYLQKHAYACAASRDLWEAFETVSDKPITDLMKSWVEQPGFPVIDVERSGDDLILTQQRFTYLPHGTKQDWLIPVSIRSFHRNGESKRITMLFEGKRKVVPLGQGVVAYKLNDRQEGFYRVRYGDAANLDELGQRVLAGELDHEDRWGLQNDLYALVKRGDVPMDRYLDFLSNYRDEDAFLPLESIVRNLFQAFLVMDGDRRDRIASVGRSLIERVLDRIGFEPGAEEKRTLSLLRDRIIWPAVLYGSGDVEKWAVDRFERLIHGQTIHPDLRKSVMQVGALRAGGGTFDWFEQALQSSESEHDRINLLTGMGCAADTRLITRVQQYTLDKVPYRNKFVPIASLASNPHAMPHMWDWFVAHLEQIEKFHPMHYERVIAMVVPSGGLGREDDVRAFLEQYAKEKDKVGDVIRLSLEKLEIFSRMRRP